MLEELRTVELDRVAVLRQAYLKQLRINAKELIESLTDEQILSGEF